MKKSALALVALAGIAGTAVAQDSPWMVRARAVNLNMANQDGTALHLTVNDKTIPEVDVSYFFTPNLAAELILSVPQKQTVSSSGASIGTFKHLPPTLFLQYHFTGLSGYKPYVGVGYNYTLISSTRLTSPYTLDGHSSGVAVQAGVDFPIDKQWSINLDVKKVNLSTHVYGASRADQGVLKLDPLLVGIGLGYRY